MKRKIKIVMNIRHRRIVRQIGKISVNQEITVNNRHIFGFHKIGFPPISVAVDDAPLERTNLVFQNVKIHHQPFVFAKQRHYRRCKRITIFGTNSNSRCRKSFFYHWPKSDRFYVRIIRIHLVVHYLRPSAYT